MQRRRRGEALAQLLKEVREEQYGTDPDARYEVVAVPAASAGAGVSVAGDGADAADDTQELPPVPAGEDYTRGAAARPARPPGHASEAVRAPGPRPARERRFPHGRAPRPGRGAADGAGRRRAAIALGVTAAALTGFALALLLPGEPDSSSPAGPAAPGPSTTAAARPPSGPADPDGAGTLREGDSGADVTALQQRLLRVPDVYTHGVTDGSYDAVLTAAVARFQLWYGIRGDETGVYGDDTRAALESRTTP